MLRVPQQSTLFPYTTLFRSYVQDKISNALVSDQGEGTINPFMVLNELEKGLRSHSLITSEEQRKRYRDLRSEEHTSELQSRPHLVCRLLLEKKNTFMYMKCS